MKKPMKKYANGVLNLNYLSHSSEKYNGRFNSQNDLKDIISKKTEEKKIHDSRLDSVKEKTEKGIREETNIKVEKAKELLGIKKTDNKKSDTLNNYRAEYSRKHEIRDFKVKSSDSNNNINYDDIFKDL